MKNFYYCLFFLSLIPAATSAQDKGDTLTYEVEAGTLLSTAPSTPFWLRSNQYGEIPLESQLFMLRGQVQKGYDTSRRFSYGYGARAALNLGGKNQLVLTELYGKIRYRAFELYAGRRREIIGLVDSTLTSGSYIWSGNARPIPKVELSIPHYTPILFKSKVLSVKGQYSHGWFGSGDSTKNYFLHQSSLYIRLGKPTWRFKVYGGINHQAQWGGSPRVPFYDRIKERMVTQFGNSFEAYANIVLGLPIDYTTRRFRTGGEVYGEGNRIGNHLGTVDLAFEYESPKSRWLLYKQSIYDDGTLYYLTNIGDGLHGLSWTNRLGQTGIRKVLFEYLQTSHQGGPLTARALINELRGQDNYFNNGVYEEGWVYRRQTIGTPFLMPLRYSTALASDARLAGVNPYYIVNNRVNAFTLSVLSRLRSVELLSRASFSQNLGSYALEYPLSIQQLSVQQRISFPVQRYLLSAVLAYDTGGVLESNLGLQLFVKRTF